MPVMRVEKNDNYTSMSNYHLRDRRLSLRAIGLLSKMLSLPPDWDYTVSGLAAICKEGRDAVRGALQELEAAGYMIRQQSHTEAGTFGKNDYIVYEQPASPPPEQPLTENPSTAEPSAVTPSAGNAAQLSKDLNKDLVNIPPIVPPGGKPEKDKSIPKWKPQRFEGFWTFYPCHKSRQAAVKAWDRLKPQDELIAVIGKALVRQMATAEWKRGIGIPYASTYLNQRRWEDEVTEDVAPPEPEYQPGGELPWI